MSKGYYPPQTKVYPGNPCPKRGQIKAGIFASTCCIKGMSKGYYPPQTKVYAGNPCPKRGQIKAGIFASACCIEGMSKGYYPPKRIVYAANPCPKRGQIKAGIFASMAKAVASIATAKGERKKKGKKSQATICCTSEENSDA